MRPAPAIALLRRQSSRSDALEGHRHAGGQAREGRHQAFAVRFASRLEAEHGTFYRSGEGKLAATRISCTSKYQGPPPYKSTASPPGIWLLGLVSLGYTGVFGGEGLRATMDRLEELAGRLAHGFSALYGESPEDVLATATLVAELTDELASWRQGPEPAGPLAVRDTSAGSRTALVAGAGRKTAGWPARGCRNWGMRFLEAESGAQALALCAQHDGAIDLLLADILMPDMSGRESGRAASMLKPEMGVIYMSGYAEDEIMSTAFSAPAWRPCRSRSRPRRWRGSWPNWPKRSTCRYSAIAGARHKSGYRRYFFAKPVQSAVGSGFHPAAGFLAGVILTDFYVTRWRLLRFTERWYSSST